MGRDKGTNDYSNNFEPQVTGLLDARTRVDTKADLLLASTWTSSDGNVYLPRGIRVSVTNDSIAANNGVYMLMDEDYSVTSNWLQIGGVEKQDKLVSGKNIKTINGQSILGSGNIAISGGSGACELHDLSMDVKTGYDAAGNPKIYFRIREKVPNGRIHFVRKKRVTYSPMGTVTYHKRVTYAPMFLDVRTAKDTGMDVSNLMENTWYEFPIKADDLIGSYPAGSDIEGSMNKRVYATIRFKGNVHAKPLVYDAPSLTKNLTVLQAGLQYNVLSGQRNPLFKQRGDIVKIDVRLKAKSPTNYNLGYEYNYAVK